jgi:hypothetical protein
MATMTLRGMDDITARTLKEAAEKEGISMNAFILRALRNALNMGKKCRGEEHHDLDGLAGTWSEDDAREFKGNTAMFEVVDEALWR